MDAKHKKGIKITPMSKTRLLTLFLVVVLVGLQPVSTQEGGEDELPVVITAANVTQLQSVQQVNFDDLMDEVPRPLSGWFSVDVDASNLVVTSEQHVIQFDLQRRITGSRAFEGVTPVRAVISQDGERVTALYVQDSEIYFIALFYDETTYVHDEVERPIDAWFDSETTDLFWLEVADPSGQSQIRQYDLEFNLLESLPYAPAQDPDAFVRIGRIDPPFAITSTIDGFVKRWNLQTGEVTAEAQINEQDIANGPPVAGQIDATGRYFAWRDPASEQLHLLDFETGENQFIADLNGDYVQYFLVSPDAVLIFAVNVDDAPIIVAWDVATGERYDLGEYRACNRVLDMARLSADGTSLIIGCDTGLDIWRIVDTKEEGE